MVPLRSGRWRLQLVEQKGWITEAITYKLGVDGIAMPFVLLTTFLMPICIIASWQSVRTRVKEYMRLSCCSNRWVIGVFVAQDLVLFYLFFDLGLVPMFLIIGIWGRQAARLCGVQFFLYTLLGSVLMLLAVMAMIWTAGTADMEKLAAFEFSHSMQTCCGSPSSPLSR